MILSELLDKGGFVMGIILVLSVYVLAVIMFKSYQFWRLGAFNTSFFKTFLEYIEEKKFSDAARIAGSTKSPLARFSEAALQTLVGSKEAEEKKLRVVEAAGARELRPFESHLRGLEMVANIAPLLGLLGTVIGMVSVFSNINQVGSRVDPALLAGGIWEALLTTVGGLSVAIPALAAHYIIEARIEDIRSKMKDGVSFIIAKSGASK